MLRSWLWKGTPEPTAAQLPFPKATFEGPPPEVPPVIDDED